MSLLRIFAATCALVVATGAFAQQQSFPPAPSMQPYAAAPQQPPAPPTLSPEQVEQALSGYDADSVAAARAYAKTFNIHGMLQNTAPQVAGALARHLQSLNPNLGEDNVKVFVDAFMDSALGENSAKVEDAAVLSMLQVFSKDELIALGQFYSSPIGAKILEKTPTISRKMPEIMSLMQTFVIPKALEAARGALKTRGVDVKI